MKKLVLAYTVHLAEIGVNVEQILNYRFTPSVKVVTSHKYLKYIITILDWPAQLNVLWLLHTCIFFFFLQELPWTLGESFNGTFKSELFNA